MSDFENTNHILEVNGPSEPKVDNVLDTNDEKEQEKNNIEENEIKENISNIITEEKDINKLQKEEELTKNEGTQKNEDNLLDNSMEKEENKSKEIEENKSKEIEENKSKEEDEEDKSKEKVNNHIKDENILSTNEINNVNISKMFNLTNNDIMNLVKSQSYLTNLPLPKNKTQSKNQINDVNDIIAKKEQKKTLEKLKEKENSICLGINEIKQKRESLENFSYELIGTKNVVENNIVTSKLKKLKDKENNLFEKLQSVKQQIATLLSKETKIDRKNNIKEYLERLNSEGSGDFSIKTKTLESEINRARQKNYKDLEKSRAKRENYFDKKEEEEKRTKEKFIKEFRKREQELAHKRKMEADKKMEEARKYMKNTYNYDPNNYLYNRLANQFNENEQKFINLQIGAKKKMSGIEEISIVKRRIIECKYELEKRRIEKTNEMKQLWHSRSVSVAKYPSNILKQLSEFNSKKLEEEEKQKMQKVVLSKERERYVKQNVALPPINEKLKSEREKRQITFLNMEGRERVKCIKNEIDKKIKNKYSIVEDIILKKLENKKTNRDNNSKSKEKIGSKSLIRSSSDANMSKNNNLKIKNLLGKSLSPSKLKMKNPHEINYLEQLRKERKIFSQNYVDWDKEIKNVTNEKKGSLENIKRQIEYLDEKFKMEKNLIKVKGGYLNNQELGDNMNKMIINAIRGKLALIDNMDS